MQTLGLKFFEKIENNPTEEFITEREKAIGDGVSFPATDSNNSNVSSNSPNRDAITTLTSFRPSRTL